jgi:hypothetical protein
VFHAEQAEVYRLLLAGENVVLSAPTSFGKSLILDAVIGAECHQTIVLVVPTIALIDETRRRLTRRFRGKYKIITHPAQRPGDRTIYVLTQERLLDIPTEQLAAVTFFAIDEFYKLDSPNQEDRSVLLNQAFHRLHATGAQFYLLGPNISDLTGAVRERLNFHFFGTDFQTVALDTEIHRVKPGEIRSALVERCRTLTGPTLLYVRSPDRAREVARWLMEEPDLGAPHTHLADAAAWIGQNYHPEWFLAKSLPLGIGIHHGRMPRALAHHMVRLFNDGQLRWLVVTSTLIEGVNTVAENVVIVDNRLARKNLDYFTYSNIRGRSGRMFKHYVGKVIVYGQPPVEQSTIVDIPAYSQGPNAKPSLLIQLPWDELTPSSKNSIGAIYRQTLLSLDTIRSVAGVDPQTILDVAEILHENPLQWSQRLTWTGRPNWDQLKDMCGFVFQLSETRGRRGGVSSPTQLATRLDLLRRHQGDIRQLVTAQLAFATEAGPDAAVEDVLDFLRQWAGHLFPRLAMALQRISKDVFGRHSLPSGDYRHYVSLVEAQFRPPVLTTLEEYGIPAPLASRLLRFLPNVQTIDQLDELLAGLRQLPRIAGLGAFESEILRDTILSL